MICSGGRGIEIRDFIFLGKEDHCRASHFQGWGGGFVGKSGYPPEAPQQAREQAWGIKYWGHRDWSENRPQTSAISASEQTAELAS